MFIPVPQPLDLAATLLSGQAFRWRESDGWFDGVLFNNVVRLRRETDGIEFTCTPDDERTIQPLLVDYLRLDVDLDAVYSSIATDQRIEAAIARFRGMRILRQDPWECLIGFICSSNSNIPRITKNVESICATFGRPIESGGSPRSTFPTPEELTEASEERLRHLGLGYRAGFVASTARAIADGALDLMALREDPYEDALGALTALDGVGDKVANCILLFSLDKPEAFPVDTHVEQRLIEWYLDGTKLSRPRMRHWAQERFGPYAGYANQYLFHDRRKGSGPDRDTRGSV